LDQFVDYHDSVSSHTKLSSLHLVREEDTNVISMGEGSYYEYDGSSLLHELFEHQVDKTPDHIALVYEDVSFSYQELNERSNQLAHYLLDTYKIVPDELIPLCLNRSEDMLIGILGVLKAGGAYVPMDPGYPMERFDHILRDTGAGLVLVEESTKDILYEYRQYLSLSGSSEEVEFSVVSLDSVSVVDILSGCSITNPVTGVKSDNLAYVIYTSGTTGKPKGVMIEHDNVVRLFSSTDHWYGFNDHDVWSLFHSYVFDVSVWEMWGALLHGGKLLIPTKEETKDPYLFFNLCHQHDLTVLCQTPTAFYQFMDVALLQDDSLSSLRYVIFAGEALNFASLHPWYARYPDSPCLVNMYGTTETTVHASYRELTSDGLGNASLVGASIPDQRIYVLDRYLRPVPVGAVGELYIGGNGLSRGYLNLPELTDERFLVNPFQSEVEKSIGYNGRMYKTGDLGRYLAGGDLEYIGRNDFQVKIRGYRIELGEIESSLVGYEGIGQSVVLAKENSSGLKYLVGYYVSDRAINAEDLSLYLSGLLPEYMVPSAYVHLEEFPLTINGKLDRRALPEPNFTGDKEYIAPTTVLEKQLVEIYGDVLGLSSESIGIHDDFFRLGGDSIISIQLVSRVRKRLSLSLSVKDIFNYRTVSRLSDFLGSRSEEDFKEILSEQGLLTGEVPLLPIQDWFFHQVGIDNLVDFHHWNQSFLINVPSLDVDLLSRSLSILFSKHDVFRMYYSKTSSGYVQNYGTLSIEPEFDILDRTLMGEAELYEIFTLWQSNFDLTAGRLFHIGYITGYEDGRARLYFAFHHLIIDVVSWRIITEDLRTIYDTLERGEEFMYTKGSSYRQWSSAISSYKYQDLSVIGDELVYWNEVVSQVEGSNALLSALSCSAYHHVDFTLDSFYTSRLLRECHEVYHTQINDLLLSALSLSLSDFTGSSLHAVLLEGHGREEIFGTLDITDTVGWFTSMYPLCLSVGLDIGSTIVHTKESLRGIPHHGLGYGGLLGYVSHALPCISFNYLGQLDQQDSGSEDWYISGDKSGNPIGINNKDCHLLNINGAAIKGELYFSFSGYFSDSALSSFVHHFQNHLKKLVDYLCGCERSYLTVSDIGSIISSAQLSHIQDSCEVSSVYLVNSLQEGFVYHALSQGEFDDAYRVQSVWDYWCELDVIALRNSWAHVQKNHPILRTRFDWSENIVQIVDEYGEVDWRFIDLSDYKPSDRESFIQESIAKDRQEAYDLSLSGLFRVYLFKHSSSHYTCIFSNHHAILDGWSMPLLLQEVHDTYLKFLKGVFVPVLVDTSYVDAQEYLQNTKGHSLGFWKDYMSLLEDREDLSSLLKESEKHINLSSYRHVHDYRSVSITLSGYEYESLKKFTSSEGITVNAVLQYLWHKQLSIYSHMDVTVVGTTVSGRNIPVEGIESSIGLYINTLPLIVDHRGEKVRDIINRIQEDVSNLNTYSDVSLAGLQVNGERIFNSLFVYENYPFSETSYSDELLFEFRNSIEHLDYPLGVVAYERGDEVVVKLDYEGLLFEESMMLGLLEGMRIVLNQLVSDPEIRTNELFYLSDTQYADLIIDSNIPSLLSDRSSLLHELFERQVDKTPDHIALVYEDVSLTYQELNERSNQLAHYLLDTYKIVPDELIPLCLNRSEDMLIGILGVLKAGGAYVPMDPGYPMERFDHILRDTGAGLVLVEESTKDILYEYRQYLSLSGSSEEVEFS
ncbi:non-ribosomal peptide synthetase, partial [Chryseobacterium potabilaquae]|uniref:non-ribosomal peptide synthetase n=1 Tax=Chryseobacterium potabilaquae TaxID=2675057 RepID=UPI00138A0415